MYQYPNDSFPINLVHGLVNSFIFWYTIIYSNLNDRVPNISMVVVQDRVPIVEEEEKKEDRNEKK